MGRDRWQETPLGAESDSSATEPVHKERQQLDMGIGGKGRNSIFRTANPFAGEECSKVAQISFLPWSDFCY